MRTNLKILNNNIKRTAICSPVKVKTVIRCTGGGKGPFNPFNPFIKKPYTKIQGPSIPKQGAQSSQLLPQTASIESRPKEPKETKKSKTSFTKQSSKKNQGDAGSFKSSRPNNMDGLLAYHRKLRQHSQVSAANEQSIANPAGAVQNLVNNLNPSTNANTNLIVPNSTVAVQESNTPTTNSTIGETSLVANSTTNIVTSDVNPTLTKTTSKPLVNFKGIPYTTKIHENTIPADLTNEDFISELLARAFIEIKKKENTTTVTFENGSQKIVGGSKYGIKAKTFCRAYQEASFKKIFSNPLENQDITKMQLKFIVSLDPGNDLFIETSLHKHFLVIAIIDNKHYVLVGFTSKKSPNFFCDKQYKQFVSEKIGDVKNPEKISNESNKKQFLIDYENLIEIPKEINLQKAPFGDD